MVESNELRRSEEVRSAERREGSMESTPTTQTTRIAASKPKRPQRLPARAEKDS